MNGKWVWTPEHVPVSGAQRGRPGRWPWQEMKHGDCFEVTATDYTDGLRLQRSLAGTAGKAWGPGNSKSRFDRHTLTVTIWRVR